MEQELLDEIRELKGTTNTLIDDLIMDWEIIAEEFDVDNKETDEPRLYCRGMIDALTDVSDKLGTFRPSQFVLKTKEQKTQ